MRRNQLAPIALALLICSGCAGARSSGTSTPPSTSTPTPTVTVTATPTPSKTKEAAAAIPWSKAKSCAGRVVTIQGPVASAIYEKSVNGRPTFLNIGRDYPDPHRFVVVIWGEDRGNFPGAPEDKYAGVKIQVTGTVTLYQGHAQMEVKIPQKIRIVW